MRFPEKAMATHSSTVAWKSHGWRILVGCSPWGLQESKTTERLHFHFSHSCIGEGNGNPLQCSCLENPRDGGAWWAAVYGVSQSWTRLKRLSSSSSSMFIELVMPSNYFVLCCPLLLLRQSFPALGSFPMNWLFASVGQSIGASASLTVLTGLILQSEGISRVFSSTTIQKHPFFGSQTSL